MEKKTYLKLLLLLVMTFSFTACYQDENNDVYYNTSDMLCSKTWVETYKTSDHYFCTHKLAFAYNGAGQEVFIYNNLDINGNQLPGVVKTETYAFSWDWYNSNHECIVMTYSNSILYFDNAWVRNDYLSGKLNGDNVTFINEANF
jgi:hypothetical protein